MGQTDGCEGEVEGEDFNGIDALKLWKRQNSM